MMKLHEYITKHLETPFEWGKHDCVLFAANWVKECSGKDPLEGVPIWSNKREALLGIKSVGGLEAALDKMYTRINPRLAVDGDVTLYNGAVALFSGSHIVGPSEEGLVFIDRMEATCAWRY